MRSRGAELSISIRKQQGRRSWTGLLYVISDEDYRDIRTDGNLASPCITSSMKRGTSDISLQPSVPAHGILRGRWAMNTSTMNCLGCLGIEEKHTFQRIIESHQQEIDRLSPKQLFPEIPYRYPGLRPEAVRLLAATNSGVEVLEMVKARPSPRGSVHHGEKSRGERDWHDLVAAVDKSQVRSLHSPRVAMAKRVVKSRLRVQI